MPQWSWEAARNGLVPIMILASLAVPAGVAQAACPDPSTGSVATDSLPATGEVIFRGSGNGHSLGMSQYGARGAAALSCSATQILTTYYRGAQPVTVTTPASLGVWMLTNGTRAEIELPVHPERTLKSPFLWKNERVGMLREGETWTVAPGRGGFALRNGRGEIVVRLTDSVNSLRLQHSGIPIRLRTYRDSSLYLSRSLKWDATKFNYDDGALEIQQRFVDRSNGRAIEKYLYGLAEVPSGWPAAALQAQAIAGRTFATKVNRVLYAHSNDQTYGGHDPARDGTGTSWRSAVDATRGKAMVDSSGRLIDALYSSSMAGHTEDRRYVWGGTYELAHLTAVDDSAWSNASNDPYESWTETFTKQHIADEFGFDRVTGLAVAAKGSTARWTGVRITGTDGGATVTRAYTGWDVRQRLGLRSPGFVVTVR